MTNKSQNPSALTLEMFIFHVYNSLEWFQFGGFGVGNPIPDKHPD